MSITMDSEFPSLHEGFCFSDFLSQIYPGLSSKSLSGLDANVLLSSAVLSEQYENYKKVNFFDFNKEKIDVNKELQLSEKNACALNAIILKQTAEGIVTGFLNPYDAEAVKSVENILNAFVIPVMVKQKDFQRILRLTYRKIEEIQKYADRIVIKAKSVQPIELINDNEDDHISELAYLMIRDAVDIDASDIHLEVGPAFIVVRLRVDGMLQKYELKNIAVGDHLVRYFKLLADVDITQDQKPSEGKKVALMVGQEDINLRISFMPTYNGQSVVIRILGKTESYQLENKITHPEYLKEIREYLSRSYGMFLISGPTGSGKTTTLYSSIQELNTIDKKIVTLEDPVEANIPGVCQVQVNESINYTFADGLRSTLRQDPDVIMVGEIRDEVTANMAVRAAVTGHLVLSTVHARGVAEIPIRLLNLKVDPYLLASAVRLTVSQRLVRKICFNCKVEVNPTEIEKAFLQKYAALVPKDAVFYRGKGCYYCQETGFSQREAIFETLHMSSEMITCLALNSIGEYMQLVAKVMRGRTLLDSAFTLALKGIIPLSEVIRMESD